MTQLIDHNPDLKKLKDEGYQIDVVNGHLVVFGVPYVNEEKKIKSKGVKNPQKYYKTELEDLGNEKKKLYKEIKEIKDKNPVPVIFMSARDQEFDRILGLEMGSEDYITKPFSMREMILRVKNVLKRSAQNEKETTIEYSSYIVSQDKRLVTEGENKISLTSKELDLLIILLQNKGTSFTRDQLLNKIWGDDYFGSDRVVDDLVKRIRKKMPLLNIETIYGYGYRLI